ncbi:MAG: SUMF1/EgtB/PvdO family nonheme iron enzyme [Deltaproteobacteria bacterium]|nr:SUMF1/EgtB/PvdO family nonheme iron enzyme [Deltaproteobacteria bacterium]
MDRKLLLVALLGVSLTSVADAQTKPRFVIAFDTSGSMATDLDGVPTFGDGVTTGCGTGVGGAYCGTDCTAGIDTDCDNEPDDSRIFIAKDALTEILLAYGDVEWALARFPQTQANDADCTNINNRECSGSCGLGGCSYTITSYGNPQCNSGAAIPTFACTDGANFPSLWPAACRPGSGGEPSLRMWNGSSPEVCINYAGGCTAGGRSGDFLVDFPNTGAFAGQENIYALLRWMDNEETSFNSSTTVGNFCNHLGGGDCELRPSGPTPLAGLMDAVRARLTGTTIPSDSRSSCRPYSVILLTDGDETCSGDPEASAAALRAAGIDVYVIGFATGSTNLDDIAASGGTGSAFFATDRDELSAALGSIVQDSLLFETCNGADDDCDLAIDEGVLNACGTCGVPPSESCNGADDDCDGTTDEGVANACGSCGAVPAEVCDGLDNDCDGPIDEGVCGGCSPTNEVCDNLDNDCDGSIDESINRPCGTDVGVCTSGTQTCSAGSFGACTGTGPSGEVCNGLDDDCDGVIDGNTRPCGDGTGACTTGTETCTMGSWGSCVGGTGPATEICDLADNDCDGNIDEMNPGGGAECGIATGACMPGTTQCMGGSLTCVGGTSGSMEVCNNIDDDCDGLTDEGNPGGGSTCGSSDTGLCERGMEVCVGGMLVCRGATEPVPELCDTLDNDCDGSTDEGNPEAGMPCGDDTGECTAGTTICDAGMLVCDGGTGPTMEICDGLDNDCDGVEDEGLGVGAPCGDDTGECSPGVNICRDGMVVCEGATMAGTEVCNLLDDDCDGTIDEGLPLGEACGTDEGLCMPGMIQCIDGDPVCVGGVEPGREACDCDDNDCDGTTDEAPDTGSLCPPGSECVECGCSVACQRGEFGFSCPGGRTPFTRDDGMGGEECFCVTPRCEADTCAMETQTRDDDTLCAPGDESPDCICKNNECTFPCDGVVCSGGTVCQPDTGRCVEDSCASLGCAADENCNADTGECEADPCATTTCGADEACRNGVCEESCGGVTCGAGEVCRAGTCETDNCDGVSCSAIETCDPETGDCVDDECEGVTCPGLLICDPLTGDCEVDPCDTLSCPGEEVCRDGECVDESVVPPDMGTPDMGPSTDPDMGPGSEGDDRTRLLATGGGGCTCTTAGAATNEREPWAPIGLALAGLLLLAWRRRRVSSRALLRRGALVTGAAAMVLGNGGCDVDPFCVDCNEPVLDAGPADQGIDAGGRDFGTRDFGTDLGIDLGPDGCLEAELCNGEDDDCDDLVDEGIDTDTDINNCGGCGMLCAPLHAFGVCTAGECSIDTCDVGWHDLDPDAEGCEYRCLATAEDDVICDLRDNDCDGDVDEDVDFDNDPINCGECARTCRFAHVTSPQCSAGTCTFDPSTDCEDGFYDVDGLPGNGCEYACTPADPATEVCNNRDDDCDGTIDEGDPGGGGTCGSSTGACSTGTLTCTGGSLLCAGEVSPATETCNDMDDDCDGSTDEGNPDGGALCGDSTGACEVGRQTCVSGSLTCVGATGPATEVCDGIDNDCDGVVDDGNPGGGGSCGSGTGECAPGTLQCTGGSLSCVGLTGPQVETCNTLDDDCDGMTDENFSLDTSISNCGGCGITCSVANGTPVCNSGTCQIGGCDVGFIDYDSSYGNGCEFACSFAGADICNGVDDDCDMMVDEGVSPPSNFCNPNGECAGTTATCGGAAGWVCNYPSGADVPERCDGDDNDCDGFVDEDFPGLGGSCTRGSQGICRTTGTLVCLGDGSGTRCTAPTPPTPASDESCNNLDDDCDGSTDEDIPLSNIPTALLPSGARIMRYEASRPDATSSNQGVQGGLACANPNVLPWTNVTWAEARDACCALNPSGTCGGGGSGWRLCDDAEWERACQGSTGSCNWAYSSGCNVSNPTRCNGEEFDSSPTSGDQDALYPTGSSTFPMCYANWGSTDVYDMSGNVKEWTNTERGSSDIHSIRGGSYNNVEDGRTCTFDFTVGDDAFAFVNTGFRCCFY